MTTRQMIGLFKNTSGNTQCGSKSYKMSNNGKTTHEKEKKKAKKKKQANKCNCLCLMYTDMTYWQFCF